MLNRLNLTSPPGELLPFNIPKAQKGNWDIGFIKASLSILLILMTIILSGCSYVGRVVPSDHRFNLNANNSEYSTFSQDGQALYYRYSLQGNSMLLEGNVYYRSSVDSLDVRFFFLDQSGTIIQQKLIFYSGYRTGNLYGRSSSFKTKLEVPNDAKGYSFDFSIQYRPGRK